MPKGSKMLKGTSERYAGFPGIIYYLEFHRRTAAPSAEALQEEIEKLDRYVGTKQQEFDDVIATKRQIEAPFKLTPEMGPTLRMVFRRAEIQLQHDITELKREREMVHNALSELPRFHAERQQQQQQQQQQEQQKDAAQKH